MATIKQAVILAAGKGTRLAPLTHTVPKAMVKVNGRPMLEIIISQLKSVGITDIIIVINYLKEKVIEHLGDGSRFGVKITYAHQPAIDGSAKAIIAAEPYLKKQSFLCVTADSLFETDLLRRILAHKSAGVFACKEVEDARAFGVLRTEGKRVIEIIEKPEHPPTNLANFSVYVLPYAIVDACKKVPASKNGEYWITEAIQLLIKDGAVFEYEKAEHILDIGTPKHLEEAQTLAKKLNL